MRWWEGKFDKGFTQNVNTPNPYTNWDMSSGSEDYINRKYNEYQSGQRDAYQSYIDSTKQYQNTADNSQAPIGGSEFLNTGDLGFRSQFGSNQYKDPNLDFQAKYDGPGGGYLNFDKSGGYLWDAIRQDPTKIVYENQSNLGPIPQSLGGGQATQTINGKNYNVNGNNYAAGTDRATPKDFTTAPGDARWDTSVPAPTGFQFGNNGSLGTMNGQFSSLTPGTTSQFFVDQPSSLNPAPNPLLGTFQPWQDPSLKALQQSRSQK